MSRSPFLFYLVGVALLVGAIVLILPGISSSTGLPIRGAILPYTPSPSQCLTVPAGGIDLVENGKTYTICNSSPTGFETIPIHDPIRIIGTQITVKCEEDVTLKSFVSGAGTAVIILDGSSKATVEGCTFRNFSSAVVVEGKEATVKSNTFLSNKTGVLIDGDGTQRVADYLITGNVFSENKVSGVLVTNIPVDTSDLYSNKGSVQVNTFNGNKGYGLWYVDVQMYSLAENNLIQDNEMDGVRLSDSSDNIHIRTNEIKNNRNGIYVLASSVWLIYHNRIEKNKLSGIVSDAGGSTSKIISRWNKISENGVDGISVVDIQTNDLTTLRSAQGFSYCDTIMSNAATGIRLQNVNPSNSFVHLLDVTWTVIGDSPVGIFFDPKMDTTSVSCGSDCNPVLRLIGTTFLNNGIGLQIKPIGWVNPISPLQNNSFLNMPGKNILDEEENTSYEDNYYDDYVASPYDVPIILTPYTVDYTPWGAPYSYFSDDLFVEESCSGDWEFIDPDGDPPDDPPIDLPTVDNPVIVVVPE
jgi:parallel beta-helix repeat protein